ncbi:MAG: hypothetical protein ACTHU0_21245 [Kofleriaceae bacterium]
MSTENTHPTSMRDELARERAADGQRTADEALRIAHDTSTKVGALKEAVTRMDRDVSETRRLAGVHNREMGEVRAILERVEDQQNQLLAALRSSAPPAAPSTPQAADPKARPSRRTSRAQMAGVIAAAATLLAAAGGAVANVIHTAQGGAPTPTVTAAPLQAPGQASARP